MIDGQVFTVALIGGMVPALLWLFFWLREDKEHPEPRGTLILAFLSGMVAVPLVLPIQKIICLNFDPGQCGTSTAIGITTIILLAGAEEIIKYIGAYATALRTKVFDEPIDAVIYMITVALGFSAIENSLFLLNPLIYEGLSSSVVTGNLRFIGASLLHLVSSATVGIFLAFAFYKGRTYKFFSLIASLIFAIALHASFNSYIMNDSGKEKMLTFLSVWFGIIVLIAFFEKIKNIRPKDQSFKLTK